MFSSFPAHEGSFFARLARMSTTYALHPWDCPSLRPLVRSRAVFCRPFFSLLLLRLLVMVVMTQQAQVVTAKEGSIIDGGGQFKWRREGYRFTRAVSSMTVPGNPHTTSPVWPRISSLLTTYQQRKAPPYPHWSYFIQCICTTSLLWLQTTWLWVVVSACTGLHAWSV